MPRTAAQTRAILVSRFPQVFMGRGKSKIPLKIGIFKDIRNHSPDLSRGELRAALQDYTSGPSYLRALMVHPYRYGLDGMIAGHVTTEHVAKANERLTVLHLNPGAKTVNQISHNAFTSDTPLTHAPGTLAPAGFADTVHHLVSLVSIDEGVEAVAERDKLNIEYGRSLGQAPASNKAATLTQMVDLLQFIRSGQKISAIKKVREMTGMGLRETKDWVEGLQSTLPPPPTNYYKPGGFLVLQRSEDNYGSSYEIMRTESYRDDAIQSAETVFKDTHGNRETILVEVMGRTKPVFSML